MKVTLNTDWNFIIYIIFYNIFRYGRENKVRRPCRSYPLVSLLGAYIIAYGNPISYNHQKTCELVSFSNIRLAQLSWRILIGSTSNPLFKDFFYIRVFLMILLSFFFSVLQTGSSNMNILARFRELALLYMFPWNVSEQYNHVWINNVWQIKWQLHRERLEILWL